MADLATRLKATAYRLIDKYGRDASLNRYVNVTTTATSTTVRTPTAYPVKLVETDFREAYIPKELVKAGDRAYLIAAQGLTVEPATDDQILDGTAKLRIAHVTRVMPGATAVVFGVLARN